MKGFDIYFDYLNLTEEEFAKKYPDEPTVGKHGKCVEVRQECYGDRHIFEDGYEEFYDIGD